MSASRTRFLRALALLSAPSLVGCGSVATDANDVDDARTDATPSDTSLPFDAVTVDTAIGNDVAIEDSIVIGDTGARPDTVVPGDAPTGGTCVTYGITTRTIPCRDGWVCGDPTGSWNPDQVTCAPAFDGGSTTACGRIACERPYCYCNGNDSCVCSRPAVGPLAPPDLGFFAS